MRKYFCIFVFVCLMLTACSQSSPTWQEQYDLGVRYLEEGSYEEAIIAFTAAIEIDPKQAPAYVGRGDAYISSGETEENLTAAQTDYEMAIELDETCVDAWLGLADVYIRQEDYKKAVEVLERARKIINNQEYLDRIEELMEIYRQKQYFTNNMLEPSELCIGNTPFWEISISDASNYYLNDDGTKEEIEYINGVYRYDAFSYLPDWWQSTTGSYTAGWSSVMMQQNDSDGLDWVKYSFSEWDYGNSYWADIPLYIRALYSKMQREDFLRDIGLSNAGVEEFLAYDSYVYLERSIDGNWIGRGMSHEPSDSFFWSVQGYDSIDTSEITIIWKTADDHDYILEAHFIYNELSMVSLSGPGSYIDNS